MPHLIHVTTDLFAGGSEHSMLRLTEKLIARDWNVSVISLGGRRTLAERLESHGAEVFAVGARPPLPGPSAWLRLRKVAGLLRPSVVQGWMYHGNLAATLSWMGRMPKVPVVWGIRQTLPVLSREKVGTRGVILTGARASGSASAIVYNSRRSADDHAQLGFSQSVSRVIANGIDTKVFRPDSEARGGFRTRAGYTDAHFVVGHLARLHPMKGHEVMIRAFRDYARSDSRGRLVIAGRGVAESREIRRWIPEDIADRVLVFPEVDRPERFLPGLDLLCSPSAWGEGFPNVVAEAMACAVPCVVTDVGDSARVVGDSGIVVKPGDVAALSDAIRVMARSFQALGAKGEKARDRIVTEFSLVAMVDKYEQLYREVM